MTSDNDHSIVDLDDKIPSNGEPPEELHDIIEDEIERRTIAEQKRINNIISLVVPAMLLVLAYFLSAFFD